jgi:glycerol-3-phosphate acyltransferase PlsX
MTKPVTLSIDALGGDSAPGIVIAGLEIFLSDQPDTNILLHGDAAALKALLSAGSRLAAQCEIAHAPDVVTSDMKPSQALRKGQGTSMWNAVEAVKEGRANASVSAGNTGALMAISMMVLRKLEGVHRPAMTAIWPTLRGKSVVLDVGANVDADARQLFSFAIMGEAYARAALGVAEPTIGLLNVGSEDMKGRADVREAAELLKENTIGLTYRGFVEGDDISLGAVDVVVTDGFTGNVALKAGEGVARMLSQRMKETFKSNPINLTGALIASAGLSKLRSQMDPSNVNGGVLLGLGGTSVKSHGGTDARGFAQACRLAHALARSNYMSEIATNLVRMPAFEKKGAGEHARVAGE